MYVEKLENTFQEEEDEKYLDVVEMIIEELDYKVLPQGEYKLYMVSRKSRCKEYVETRSKYRERVKLLKLMYKAIKADLLYDMCIYKSIKIKELF